jgi:hypothetical protein
MVSEEPTVMLERRRDVRLMGLMRVGWAREAANGDQWASQSDAHQLAAARRTPDTSWMPMLTTPAYPDYVSGYSGITGAFTRALADALATSHLCSSPSFPPPPRASSATTTPGARYVAL